MKRKMVAVMLSTAMVFGLAACGGGNDKEASTDTGTKDTKEAEDTKDDAEEADDAGEAADNETKESTADGDREEITLFRSDDGNGAVEAIILKFLKRY